MRGSVGRSAAAVARKSSAKPPKSSRRGSPRCRRARGSSSASTCRSSHPRRWPRPSPRPKTRRHLARRPRPSRGRLSPCCPTWSIRSPRPSRRSGARASAACISTAGPSTWMKWRRRPSGIGRCCGHRGPHQGGRGRARVRLTDSIETAYTEGGGAAFASNFRLEGGKADAADRVPVFRAVRMPAVQHPV